MRSSLQCPLFALVLMEELTELEHWRALGYGVVISGAGSAHTGFDWVCSILVDHTNMATGANDNLLAAIRAAITQARVKYGEPS